MRRSAVVFSLLLPACGPGAGKTTTGDGSSSGSETGEASSTGSATADTATTGVTEPTTGPGPDYVRECQPGDFTCGEGDCDPWVAGPGKCFKTCTPTKIGEVDAECDEPGRPFCSQFGQFEGGDFSCNGCVHVCSSVSVNWCEQDPKFCDP